MTYQRITTTAWEWQIGNACMTVHYDPDTQQLIWSSLTSGTTADDGVAQDASSFWVQGPLFADMPQGLLQDLQQIVPQPQQPVRPQRKTLSQPDPYTKPSLLKRLLGRR
jgi:hypothetical protein